MDFRQRQVLARPCDERFAVFDVAGKGLLPAVEIDRRDAVIHPQQRDHNMHCRRGFPGAALFVADHDRMGTRLRVSPGFGHQRYIHALSPVRSLANRGRVFRL